MTCAYISHPACRLHDMGGGHPESPQRLAAIEAALRAEGCWDRLSHLEAPRAPRAALLRVHAEAHVAALEAHAPEHGLIELDPDTAMNPHSLEAAHRAAGAGLLAVDRIMAGEIATAFCAVRPPGHHATRNRAMGFCLFNNLAVAVAHGLAAHGLSRVAIVDFDVHHGNGTEAIFSQEPRVLLCSSFQHPHYPYCGADTVSDHIIPLPLPHGTAGPQYRAAFAARLLPALEAFQPEFVFCSAGFDGHRDDPLAGFNLVEADYAWITEQVMALANRHAHGRVVSFLEGGYNLHALGHSAAAHIRVLAGFNTPAA